MTSASQTASSPLASGIKTDELDPAIRPQDAFLLDPTAGRVEVDRPWLGCHYLASRKSPTGLRQRDSAVPPVRIPITGMAVCCARGTSARQVRDRSQRASARTPRHPRKRRR